MIDKILKPIFWDTRLENIDPQKNARYVIERILEWGDFPHVRWMEKNYTKKQIIAALKVSRELSLKSANFWSDYYNVPKSKIKCLSKPFLRIRQTFWPY